MKKYEIIVSPYRGKLYGLRLACTDSFDSDSAACEVAGVYARDGFCVIVRPCFNEANGSFHEYRSFDGKRFQLVTFDLHVKREPTETELCG